MGKYRKILVPIDGSESSLHALSESFKLAQNEGSWITALCVVPPYVGDLSLTAMQNLYDQMKKPCEEALKKAKDLSSKYRILIKTEIEEGEPHERIVDFAEALNCDLIVIGRHGLSRLEKVLLGSVTARVIGYSPIDVLVVPKGASIDFQNILLTTDGSKFSYIAERRAIDLAKSYGGKLTILSVIEIPIEIYAESPQTFEDLIEKTKEYVENLKRQAEVEGIKVESMVMEGNPYKIILEISQKIKPGIILMGSHGKTGLKRLLMGSVTEKVIGFTSAPVLVVK